MYPLLASQIPYTASVEEFGCEAVNLNLYAEPYVPGGDVCVISVGVVIL